MKKCLLVACVTLCCCVSMQASRLHDATRRADVAAVEERLKLDKLNEKDAQGKTALMYAVALPDLSIAKKLLEANADVNAQDTKGETAVMHAAMASNEAALELLAAANADLNKKDTWGDAPIIRMAKGGSPVVIKLIRLGADLNIRDKGGMTALMYAVSRGHGSEIIVDELLAAGANPDLKDSQGLTALAHAIDKGYFGSVNKLLIARADVHAQDNKGKSILDRAIATGNKNLIDKINEQFKLKNSRLANSNRALTNR